MHRLVQSTSYEKRTNICLIRFVDNVRTYLHRVSPERKFTQLYSTLRLSPGSLHTLITCSCPRMGNSRLWTGMANNSCPLHFHGSESTSTIMIITMH